MRIVVPFEERAALGPAYAVLFCLVSTAARLAVAVTVTQDASESSALHVDAGAMMSTIHS